MKNPNSVETVWNDRLQGPLAASGCWRLCPPKGEDMLDDMVQIKLTVEGMKAQIIKCFDTEHISGAIQKATDRAVKAFDMESYIKYAVEGVFNQAREAAITELSEKYGEKWADDLSEIIDKKIGQALKETK